MLRARRPHLKAKTTAVLNALADVGPGGAPADEIARRTHIRTRNAAARLRWLQRGGLVRYVEGQGLWQLTDDSMFNTTGDNKP